MGVAEALHPHRSPTLTSEPHTQPTPKERGRGQLLVRGPMLSLRYPVPGGASRLFELASDAQVTRLFSWGAYRHETGLEGAVGRGTVRSALRASVGPTSWATDQCGKESMEVHA